MVQYFYMMIPGVTLILTTGGMRGQALYGIHVVLTADRGLLLIPTSAAYWYAGLRSFRNGHKAAKTSLCSSPTPTSASWRMPVSS